MKKVIAIDIDDVIADSTEAFRKRVNEHTGANLQPHHYKVQGEYWGYYERVWAEHGIELNQDEMDAEMIIDQSRISLLPGAGFAISELSKKHKVVIVTARDPRWEEATRKWLQKHFGKDAPRLYFSEAHRKFSSQTKGQICKDLGASWLIDDNVNHCQTAQDEGVQPVLFGSYGWHYDVPEDFPRCRDWQAVLEYFDAV